MLALSTQTHFKINLHGMLTRPTALMIGSWDPFLPSHEKILCDMRQYADRNDFDTAVVLLNPPPASYLPGNEGWPLYDDMVVRLHKLLRCGVSGVIEVEFERQHLQLGAADICDTLESVTSIADMWIGPRQTLGRGSQGNYEQLLMLGKARGFNVTRLSEPYESKDLSGQVRSLIRRGRIHQAHGLVGRAPTLACPMDSMQHIVTWPSGTYHAFPLPCIDSPLATDTVAVMLHATDAGVSQFEWPCPASPYLAFVAGAAD